MSLAFSFVILVVATVLTHTQLITLSASVVLVPILLVLQKLHINSISWDLILRQLGCGFFLLIVAYKIKRDSEKTYQLYSLLHQASFIDGLTNVYNRKGFDLSFEKEVERAKRSGESLGLVVFDIDHFKLINDQYGHQIGDKVIAYVAKTLEAETRSYDLVARVGGEEFMVLFPKISQDDLSEKVESIIEKILKQTLAIEGAVINFTISAGVDFMDELSQKTCPHQFIKNADLALYRAKNNGRNRAEFHQQQSPSECQA